MITVRSASWHQDAEEVKDPAVGVPLGEVADRCGLKARTITYAMARTRPTVEPLATLARPAYRYRAEPRWSEQQISDYCAARDARDAGFRNRYGDLPTLSGAEARKRGLVGLRQCAKITGVALTTLHRWANHADFPAPVALVGARGPTPRVMRSWPAVADWLRTNRPQVEVPDSPHTED